MSDAPESRKPPVIRAAGKSLSMHPMRLTRSRIVDGFKSRYAKPATDKLERESSRMVIDR